MSEGQHTPADPRQEYPKPDYPQQEQPLPGHDAAMDPEPDHGETSYVGRGRLQGRRALVTGGDSGIGRAVTIAFAREGADVVISCLPDEEKDAAQVADLVEQTGQRCVVVAGDVRDEKHCRGLVQRTVDELGGIDVLVSNAAHQLSLPGGLEDVTTEQL